MPPALSSAPSIESVTEALATAKIPEDFRFSMVNPPGAKAYPIAGATWLLVYEQQKDAAKGKKLVEFLNWAMTEGEGSGSHRWTTRRCLTNRRQPRPRTHQNHKILIAISVGSDSSSWTKSCSSCPSSLLEAN